MIISKCLTHTLLKKFNKNVSKVIIAKINNRSRIGNRDWVGFGKSGDAYYADDPQYPYPAIRFKENSNELLALKEKEKGDWRKLTIEEKKILYRASFRQTFSEIFAPNGEWKIVIGWTLICVSLGLWLFIAEKMFVYPKRPDTFSEEKRAILLRQMLVQMHSPLSGYPSKWDYIADDWK